MGNGPGLVGYQFSVWESGGSCANQKQSMKTALLVITTIALTSCASNFPLPGGNDGRASFGYYKPTSNLDPEGKLGIFIERVGAIEVTPAK